MRRASGIIKAALIPAAVFVILQGSGFSMQTAGAAEKDVPHTEGRVTGFRWFPTVEGWKAERVKADTEVVVPVEVEVEGDVSEVIFEISSEYRSFGIRFEKATCEVREGKALSKVVFKIVGGMPLGRHDLGVRIIDRRTGAEIGNGTIPFLILPSDLECLC